MEEFKNSWTVYFHSLDNNNWTLQSYQKLTTITTIKSFWEFMNNLPELTNGSFFFMKDDIPPIWEDPSNKSGGTWNIFSDIKNINPFIELILIYTFIETLTTCPEDINGISLTPKPLSYSIKIWNKNVEKSKDVEFNKNIVLYNMNYRAHNLHSK